MDIKQSSEKRFALLIDADNVSAKYIKPITDELSKYGTVTYKRIYGDWTLTLHAKWKDALLENSITPIQQFGYTQGKNATDSAMIIDAMDILYTGQVDGFVLVSSDSDFTRLAIRLREAGKKVYGMGEKKTPNPFIVACDKFVYIEVIRSAAQQERAEEAAREEPKEPPKTGPGARPERRGPRPPPAPAPEAEPPPGCPRRSSPCWPTRWRCWPTRTATPPWARWPTCWCARSGTSTPQLWLLQAEQAGQGPAPVRGGRPPGRPVQHEALLCPGQGAEITRERAAARSFFLTK